MSRCNGAVHNRNAASAAAFDLARTAALLDVASCLAVLGPVLTDRASFRRLFAERASFRRRGVVASFPTTVAQVAATKPHSKRLMVKDKLKKQCPASSSSSNAVRVY